MRRNEGVLERIAEGNMASMNMAGRIVAALFDNDWVQWCDILEC